MAYHNCKFFINQLFPLRNVNCRGITHAQGMKNCFITTPIYYVNAEPHIGHLYTSVLADAIARYERLKNPALDLKFMTGTDEHGLKISLSAEKHNMDEQGFCDNISKKYRELFDMYNISYTDFLRTTEDRHVKTVTRIWTKIAENGHIYLGEHSGWYCVSDETFVPETFLEPDEGSDIRYTKEFRKPVHFVKEMNYKFKLSHFQKDLIYWIRKDAVVKPELYAKQLQRLIETEELWDLSISRPSTRVKWGIPVPNDPSQSIYVWLDALTSYITSSGYPESMTHWPPTIQVIGKDILKFHGVYWPAFLMAAGMEPPHCILCHSHWKNEGKKMSKSLGNVIDPFSKKKTFTSEGFRYFLLLQSVPHCDSNYHEREIGSVINSDLANKLANLLNRCCSKALNKDLIFPSYSESNHLKYCKEQSHNLIQSLEALPDLVFSWYEDFEFGKGVAEIMGTIMLANKFFQDTEPWKLTDPCHKDHLRAILHITLETLRICGILLQPIVPEIAENLLNALCINENERNFDSIRPYSWQREDVCGDVCLAKLDRVLFQRLKLNA